MNDYETDTTITPEPYKNFHAFVNEDPEALEKQEWIAEEHQRISEENNQDE